MKPFSILKGSHKVAEGVIFNNRQCVVHDTTIQTAMLYDNYEQMSELFLEPKYGKSYRMMLLFVEGAK